MKQDKRRGLTRIALALALAGYCVAPVALAEDSASGRQRRNQYFPGPFRGSIRKGKCYDRCRPCNVDF